MTALFEVAATDVALTTDEWYTPRWLFDAAGLTFDMDVCAPVEPVYRTCPARSHLTVVEDGLTAPWSGMVWCNPPYSNPAPWVERFAAHEGAGMVLVPASNSYWRGHLMNAADGVALVSIAPRNVGGAITGFGRPDGSRVGYPMALILASRGAACVEAGRRVSEADPYSRGAYHVRPA